MSKYLCTFSGKFGDILWSLPTARYISEVLVDRMVDFAVMPQYKSLCPLLQEQEYIYKAFTIDDWQCVGSPYGDQPWEPPKHVEEGYDKVWHLTYRQHPYHQCLVDYIAGQQGITLFSGKQVIPFLHVTPLERPDGIVLVTYAFNEQHAEQKQQFIELTMQDLGQANASFLFADVSKLSWIDAARRIASSDIFIGCRSGNWVVAMGMGKETITYEPNPSRNAFGPWGKVFGCPYGKETSLHHSVSPYGASNHAAAILRNKLENMKASAEKAKAKGA